MANKRLSELDTQGLQGGTEFYVQYDGVEGSTTFNDIVDDHGHDLGDITDAAGYVRMSDAERVKLAGIESGASNVPIGALLPFAGASAPTDYVICDGQELAEATYPVLFALIGTTYNTGGETTNYFRVPDMKGRVPIGSGLGSATDATSRSLGEVDGAETHQLTVDELASHRHSMGADDDAGISTGDNTISGGDIFYTDYTGGDVAHNNMQPYLTLNYIIRVL